MNEDTHLPKILMTTGEPASVGPEICLQWLTANGYFGANQLLKTRIVLVGDLDMLRERAARLQIPANLVEYGLASFEVPDNGVEVWHHPLAAASIPQKLDVRNARYVLDTLDAAISGCMSKMFDAVVTAPIHKGIINEAGIDFTGHTEYFAKQTDTDQVVMMLTGNRLKVALVTTHMPLKKVPEAITQSLIVNVLTVLERDLTHRFGIASPRILVTGLNPHAGEQGHLGREEVDIIEPAIKQARQQGIDCLGPIPGDTVFLPERLVGYDAILSMFHDQGLATLKYASFGEGANITLGLPFIRTSVDHGCALDLAGSGMANIGSLNAAVEQAIWMARVESGML